MKVNELEDKILSMWATADDIDTFLHRYLESPAGDMSEDDIANTFLGIKTMHDQRCQKLWDSFEKVLANSVPHKMPAFDSNGIREDTADTEEEEKYDPIYGGKITPSSLSDTYNIHLPKK